MFWDGKNRLNRRHASRKYFTQRGFEFFPRDPLTEREAGVLKLIAQGMSNREIAERLVITERTVCTHVSNILSKLHLASRTQAALYALKEGLSSLDDVSIEGSG